MRKPLQSSQEIKDFKWYVLKFLWPYLLEFKFRIFLACSCLVLAKIASVSLPFILKHIVDSLDTSSATQVMLFVPLALVIAYGCVRFVNVILGEVRDTLFGRITERAMRRIGLKVFIHLHQLDLEFHLNRRTGGLSRDIERGISGISFLMRFMVFNIIPTLLEILLVVVVFFYNYGFIFALITIFSVFIYIAFSMITTEWRTKYIREVNLADSSSTTRSIDSLLNFETVKYFTNESLEAARYDRELEQWEQAKRKNRLSLFALNAGQAFIIAAAMSTMMFIAVIHVANENMTLGDFVLINAFMMQLFMPLNFLGFVYREIKSALANIESMFSLLKQKAKVIDIEGAKELKTNEPSIHFDNISFFYESDRTILENISFFIRAQQTVAIVGESGSGKSTLAKLLFRFYDVTNGCITINGEDIRSFGQQSLRRIIGVVPQDPVLFNDTIYENIKYGCPTATEAEIERVVKMAHLEHFINSLAKGYHTLVGERGLKLSGGEKQRVAIARTLLKQPKILIFDEATSSLDSHSEQAILQAIEKISQTYTCMVIAHRLSTVVHADHIIVLAKGRIVEHGNHQQLLSKQGVYATLWRLQQSRKETNID